MPPKDEECPRIREIDFFPVKNRNGTFIALRDPLDFSPQILAFRPALLPVIALMDGTHTLSEIAETVERENKVKISIAQLKEIVRRLDESLFLSNDYFQVCCKKIIEDFLASKIRPAAHAGESYPDEPEGIHAYFSDHFLSGPGFPRLNVQQKPPRALICPHVDIRVGGPTFAWAYKTIAESEPIDLFIILGIAHCPTRYPFCATRKDFETPLGIAKTNHDFLNRLQKKVPFNLFADEYAHRHEHSIEFQLVYLQSILPIESQSIHIVPILCGSFSEFVSKNTEPSQNTLVSAFIEALKHEIAAEKKRICVIAGVDLAHMGGRFGDDDLRLTPSRRRILEETDLEMLDVVMAGDASQFFKYIAAEQDKRRICGLPAIYTMLKVLPLKNGELLDYNQSYEKATESLISFCSAKFE